MTELKNVEQELSRFNARVLAAGAFVLFTFGLLAARLVHLQVYKHEELSTQAENNRIAVVPIVPNRGLILDRNGIVLANNYSAYTLEITPSKVGPLEPLIDRLAEIVDIQPRDRKRLRRLMEESKSFESLPIRTKLSDEEVARFTARRFEFPGVDIKARLFRNYPLADVGSHLLGYIGRINQAEKDKIDESDDAANYRGTDYIGKLGVEQSYEADLHGQTGFEEVETSAAGRPVRRLKSSPATPGNTVILSIDIKLQALVEQLFGDRRGALVALDPRSGEVLAFVSKPTFDPNLFVDGIDQESWRDLNESIDKPLLNRALRGTYPPGSTFKPFMAMAALNTGKRSPSQVIFDGGTFQFGNHTFRSHGDHGLGPVDMARSIIKSSNVYYYSLANELGVDLMHDQLDPFGFGRKTGIDVEGEVTGLLPSTEWKRRAYRKPEQQKWYAGETISLGIGQGYNNFTMLQLASATATLVSGGKRFKPRLVREIEDVVTRERRADRERCARAVAAQAGERRDHHAGAVRSDAGRHLGAILRRGALQDRRQDRHRAGGGREGEREVQRRQDRRAPARPRAVHGFRAAGGADDRARHHRRERRLRLGLCRPDHAPRVRLRHRRPVPERGRHRVRSAMASAGRRSASSGRPHRCRCRAASWRPARRRPPRSHRPRSHRPHPNASPSRSTAVSVASRPAPMNVAFEKPSLLQRIGPVFTGFDVPLTLRDPAARRCRAGDDVLGRFRPRHTLRRPRPQHAARAGHPVRGGAGAAAEAHGAGAAAVRARRRAAGRHRAVRHHQEGRDALAQRRHGDPAERDAEDRDAADARVVVPAARGPVARTGFHRRDADPRAAGRR